VLRRHNGCRASRLELVRIPQPFTLGRKLWAESAAEPQLLRLFPALRRQGVITEVRQHTEGSFAVRLASLRTLVEAPRRRRHPTPRPVRDPEALRALLPSTRALLRRLATVSLEALGVRTPTEAFIGDEMLRQFDRIAPSVPHGPVREAALRAALERAIEEYG